MSNEEMDILDKLILDGAIEVAGIDSSTGEFTYAITQKMKDIFPEIYKEHIMAIHHNIMFLWESRYLTIDLMTSDPLVLLTDKAYDQKEVLKLSPENAGALKEIKRIMGKL
jgi:hypothetical protein